MSFRNLFTRGLIAAFALFVGSQALAARTTTYFHNDGLGSVVAATNQAGQVLWRKDYAPFGEQIDTTPDNERTAYTGKQHDDVIGLTDFGGRNFDPELGRFVSVDPVGFVETNPMSFNRYLYVNNNPYKYVDPDGEFLNFAAKFVLDVGINMAINYLTTGELNVTGALKDSVIGIWNPAKTAAGVGKLGVLIAKANKVAPCPIACFAAGTAVLTEQGYLPIELIEVGTKVWAHDPDTGVTALKPVLATFVNTQDSVWDLAIEKDGELVRHSVTGSHPYYVLDEKGGGAWVHVADLAPGARFITHGGGTARLVSLVDTRQMLTTYNFEVADINTYYVSAAMVLVHNCKKKIPAYSRDQYKALTANEKAAVKTKDPVCVYCEKRPSETVDHVRSQKRDWTSGGYKDTRDVRSARVNDPANLRGACTSCNPSKGSKELGTEWTPPKDR